MPLEYTALSTASGRGASLDGYPELVENGVPYFIEELDQGLRSSFPIGASLVAWPLYLPVSMLSDRDAETVHSVGRFASLARLLAAESPESGDPTTSPPN